MMKHRYLITGLTAMLAATTAWCEAGPLVYGQEDFVPTPERPAGFRGDGSGRFPGATPPATWDAAKGAGVKWRTALPGASESSVIVVRKKVFAAASPHALYCLDAGTGAVLWQKDVDPSAVLAKDGADAVRGDLAALVAEYKANPPKDAAAQKALGQRIQALAAKGAVSNELPYGNFFSLSAPTPASDGQRVYVQFPAGVLAAYDLDGNPVWKIPAIPSGWAMGNASPIVCRGKVLAITGQRNSPTLMCVESATGKVLWTARFPTADHCGAGSPVVVPTPDGPKVAVPVNKLFDLETGKESFSHDYYTAIGATPVVDGARVIHIHGDYGQGVKRQVVVLDCAGKAPAATGYPRQGSGHLTASPLVFDGKVYLPDGAGLTPEVLNLADGKELVVPNPKAPLARSAKGQGFLMPSPALAGGHIYQALADGRVLVIAPAVPLKVLAVNTVAPMNGSPYFQGERIYFRTQDAVWCIGNP